MTRRRIVASQVRAAAELARAERVGVAEAMLATGLRKRTVQNLAARGLIPGAAKLGGLWTFDRVKLRRWIAAKEREACRETSISEAASGMDASRLAGRSYAKAYERAISGRPKGA